MGKLRSLVSIHHSPTAKDAEARKARAEAGGFHNVEQRVINPGDTFDPSEVEWDKKEVEKRIAAGQVVDADDEDSKPNPAEIAKVTTGEKVAGQGQQGQGEQPAPQRQR